MPDGQNNNRKEIFFNGCTFSSYIEFIEVSFKFDDELLLISLTILEPIIKLKEKTLKKIDIYH